MHSHNVNAFITELFYLLSVSELAELESIRKALSFGQEHKSSSSSMAAGLQGSVNDGHENGDLKSVQSKRMSLDHFSFIKVLGKGSFGKVGICSLNIHCNRSMFKKGSHQTKEAG